MFGKIFASMYDGSLRTRSPWQALVTFQQMIVLANKHGELDMTAEALSFRTGIPLDVITLGISALSTPDPESRSDAEEGRRIVPLDPDRSWGWRLVNFLQYREMRSQDERREYMKNLMREKRKREKASKSEQALSDVSNVSLGSKQYAVSSSSSSSSEQLETLAMLARDELLTLVPSPASWSAEMDAALQGMHGPALSPVQLEQAIREYLGNGATANPSLRHFRGYLRRAVLPPPPSPEQPAGTHNAASPGKASSGDGIVILGKIREMIETSESVGNGIRRYIRLERVKELGADAVAAYKAVGGSDAILGAKPEALGFLARDFSAALAAARAGT